MDNMHQEASRLLSETARHPQSIAKNLESGLKSEGFIARPNDPKREKILFLLGQIWGIRSYSNCTDDEIIMRVKEILVLMGMNDDE